MKSKYIKMVLIGKKPKTLEYAILTKSDNYLIGEIRWYAPWRQYSFFPAPHTVFTKSCMTDINNFITELMEERK